MSLKGVRSAELVGGDRAAFALVAGGELETDFPYGVVRQLFEPALADEPEPERLLVGAAALARPVFALPDARPSQAGDSFGLEALHGLYWLTVNLAGSGPVLFAVDDVRLV